MEYMGTAEASNKWGYKKDTISRWCREGKISGAEQDKRGSPWRIPNDVKCPKPLKGIYY